MDGPRLGTTISTTTPMNTIPWTTSGTSGTAIGGGGSQLLGSSPATGRFEMASADRRTANASMATTEIRKSLVTTGSVVYNASIGPQTTATGGREDGTPQTPSSESFRVLFRKN
ncbi:unnamed protein product [Protopolystoma xenopodis]|uniref:Uncharacterized protein n=1 Tax=Protopolystoma xenopodis TaxID=117903 RepID=A0A3S5A5G7_9PLAT|nr:unnamed protein product [Protopolystoma xenopodis]